MIKSYKEHCLDGIRSKRKNAGRIPKISSDKNKQLIKDTVLKSPRSFGYLRNTWSIRLLAGYLTDVLKMNECQSNADLENNPRFRNSKQKTKISS